MCGFFLHAAGNAANPRFLALLVLNPGVLLRSPLPLVGHNFKRGKKACCNHCSKGGATFTCDECNFSVHEDCKAAVITPCRTAEEDALLWSAPPLSDRPSDRPSPLTTSARSSGVRSHQSRPSSIVTMYTANRHCIAHLQDDHADLSRLSRSVLVLARSRALLFASPPPAPVCATQPCRAPVADG